MRARCAATASTSPTAPRSTAYAAAVAEQFGRVNVVVNNAGVALSGDVEDLDYDDMDWIIGINFWGVVHGTKAFLPHLIASGDGHVVNLSSLFGLISMPGPVDVQRLEVRRPRLHRGAPRGDARGRPPGRRDGRPPRRHQDRDRPQRAATPTREDAAETAALFDEKLAKMTPERAAEIIVTKGDPRRPGPGARRPRRARPAPLRPPDRLPLPGRRRRPSPSARSPPSADWQDRGHGAGASGDPVRIEMTKWGDRPHWHIPGHWLGSDEHGDWIGIPSGTLMVRPGMQTVSAERPGRAGPARRGARLRAVAGSRPSTGPGPRWACRCTSTSPPRRVWDGTTLRTVDLDLDVVRETRGPDLRRRRGRVRRASGHARLPGRRRRSEPSSPAPGCRPPWRPADPPYDGSHRSWLNRVRDLPRS